MKNKTTTNTPFTHALSRHVIPHSIGSRSRSAFIGDANATIPSYIQVLLLEGMHLRHARVLSREKREIPSSEELFLAQNLFLDR